MAEFASNGKGNLGVTLGAIGTGLSLLGENLPIFNNNNNKDFELAQLKAEKYADKHNFDLYKDMNEELRTIRQSICDNNAAQAVVNAQVNSAISVLGTQVNSINTTIGGLTKTIVPSTSVVTVTTS